MAIEIDRGDVKYITSLEKLNHESLALKRSVENNSDLMFESNLLTDLDSC